MVHVNIFWSSYFLIWWLKVTIHQYFDNENGNSHYPVLDQLQLLSMK